MYAFVNFSRTNYCSQHCFCFRLRERFYLACFERLAAQRLTVRDAVLQNRNSSGVIDTEEKRDRISFLATTICDPMNSRLESFVCPTFISVLTFFHCLILDILKLLSYQIERQSPIFTTNAPGIGGATIHSPWALRTCKPGVSS